MRAPILAALAVLFVGSPAAASDTLDGTYVLDLDASDDLGDLMKELGMNALMRSVIGRMKTRLTIDGEPDEVTLSVKTPVRSQTQELACDGSVIAVEGGEFGSGSMSVRWSDDGASLISVSDTEMGDGRPIHTVTTRRLEEPDTLLQQFEVSIDGGEPRTIRRIFRRAD